nr:MAG TPA: hypothetical protein [Caudoviricetes sp.]
MFEVNQIIAHKNNKYLVLEVLKTEISGKEINAYVCKWINTKTGKFFPGTTYLNDSMF